MAPEILIATPAVRNLIRESKTHQLPSMMQTGKKYGMQLLDDAIMNLYNKGWISADEAYAKANDKEQFKPFLRAHPTVLQRHSFYYGLIQIPGFQKEWFQLSGVLIIKE